MELLHADGRVVIATSIGCSPHFGAERALFLPELIGLLKPRFGLELFQVEDGNIRVVVNVLGSNGATWNQLDDAKILELTEAAFAEEQRRLYDDIHRLGNWNAHRETQISAAKEHANDLKRGLETQKNEVTQLERELQGRSEDVNQLERELRGRSENVDQLERELRGRSEHVGQLERELQRRSEHVGQLERELRGRSENVDQLERSLNEEMGKAGILERAAETTNVQTAKLRKLVLAGQKREALIRSSIRWRLGSLIVDVARNPLRSVRLPIESTRIVLAAYRQRAHGPKMDSGALVVKNGSISQTHGLRTIDGSSGLEGRNHSDSNLEPTPRIKDVVRDIGDSVGDLWFLDQIRGEHVVLFDGTNPSLIGPLTKSKHKVTVYDPEDAIDDSASSARETTAIPQNSPRAVAGLNGGESIASHRRGLPDQVDAVVIRADLGDKGRFGTVLRHACRCLQVPGSRLVVIVPRYLAMKKSQPGADVKFLATQVRERFVPVSLSLEDGELRFVARLGQPCPDDWIRFEADVLHALMDEVVRSLRIQRERDRRNLEQSLRALRSSVSFRAGEALVSVAKEPRTLWRLPKRLWHLYRSTRLGRGKRRAEKARAGEREVLTFPALEVPDARTQGRPVVAAVLDPFSEYCLRYEFDLQLLTPKGWETQLEQSRPAFLLVESAWAGNNGAWRYMINNFTQREFSPLRDLLPYCRDHGIPTIFWNKEDPPNFDLFIDAAKEFDIIFTTDVNTIPKYREICGHDRIHCMPFAAQPRIHNPSRKSSWQRHPVCFAGSWMEKHKDRIESLPFLLDPAIQFGLHIFDRNFSRTTHRASGYRFPERYQAAIKGTLEYNEMLTAYRCYAVMLNTNSVTCSPTMFSRRIFESLACGTPVLSTESVGMRNMLGKHVRVTKCADETIRHLTELFADDEARAREGHLAYRYVHKNHTYFHRVQEMLEVVGLKPDEAPEPAVSVVVATCRPKNVRRALENIARQRYTNLELILVLNNATFDLQAIESQLQTIPNARVVQIEGRTKLPVCLNRAVLEASGDYIAKMDDDDYYGEEYISDMMLATRYSDADVLGKGTYFAYMEETNDTGLRTLRPEHEFTNLVAGPTLVVRREVLKRIKFPEQKPRGSDTGFLRRAVQEGCSVYSSDRFNFILVRRSKPGTHTWNIDKAEFRKSCQRFESGLDLRRMMI